MKKAVSIAFSRLLVSGHASAISRRDISRMSCEQTKALVRSEGAVILRFPSPRNPSAILHGRYVSDDRYCGSSEQTTRASMSAADNEYCPVRKCVVIEFYH